MIPRGEDKEGESTVEGRVKGEYGPGHIACVDNGKERYKASNDVEECSEYDIKAVAKRGCRLPNKGIEYRGKCCPSLVVDEEADTLTNP